MKNMNKFRIFSCDGGGFRGYLTSLILERLEDELISLSQNSPSQNAYHLGDYFDMYAGTSTGSLIACGLAAGISARRIREIYEEIGGSVFPEIRWQKELRYRIAQFLSIFTRKRLQGMTSDHRFLFSSPLFDGKKLKEAVEKIFQDTCLGDLSANNKRVLVTAYDCWNSLPVVFDSYNELHKSLKVVDILLASSAYPGGFPSHVMDSRSIHDQFTEPGYSLPPNDNCLPLVDGGLVANNPALLTLTKYYEERKHNSQPPIPVVMASFGTGKLVLQFKCQQTRDMGQLDWTFPFGGPLLDVVYGGYSKIIDWLTASLINNLANETGETGDNYFRFQPHIFSEQGQALNRCPSPDSVLLNRDQRKVFEMATFQYNSKNVLKVIANQYLQDKDLDGACLGHSNLELQVSERVQMLAKSLFMVDADSPSSSDVNQVISR
ncbi:MAG: patatin-like phospholipase family protein [Oculatellaceae cyanobacterium bins.114]|nr:patatin-like phospholipase family protein [Oculatellaceae cyanobacterium bins.114]